MIPGSTVPTSELVKMLCKTSKERKNIPFDRRVDLSSNKICSTIIT